MIGGAAGRDPKREDSADSECLCQGEPYAVEIAKQNVKPSVSPPCVVAVLACLHCLFSDPARVEAAELKRPRVISIVGLTAIARFSRNCVCQPRKQLQGIPALDCSPCRRIPIAELLESGNVRLNVILRSSMA